MPYEEMIRYWTSGRAAFKASYHHCSQKNRGLYSESLNFKYKQSDRGACKIKMNILMELLGIKSIMAETTIKKSLRSTVNYFESFADSVIFRNKKCSRKNQQK